MHDNQLDISPDVVQMLIDQQFPRWRSLPVRHVAATGTVNAIFRIGDLYAARFPLKAGDVDVVRRSLEAEAKAGGGLWARGKAWAFQQSMGLVWYHADSNPAMAGIGRRTLDRLVADERP